jgi:hypothetical protein
MYKHVQQFQESVQIYLYLKKNVANWKKKSFFVCSAAKLEILDDTIAILLDRAG